MAKVTKPKRTKAEKIKIAKTVLTGVNEGLQTILKLIPTKA